MPTAAELQIVIAAQDRASAQLRELGGEVTRIERQVESAGGAFGRLGGVIGGLGKIGLAAGGISTIVDSFRGAFDAVGSVVGQASDLNEQLSRSEQVFGDAAGSVQAFAKTTADALGITQREALQAAGDFGQLLRTSGLTADASADMSTTLVRLAADLASFNNIRPEDALEKLRSGLVGEAEPLRTLGVMLSEDAVKTEALRLGLARNASELTEAAKVQARYSLILQQTGQAQGDFAKTSDGLANSTRRIRAAWEDITTVLGAAFLPVVARVAKALADLLKAVRPVAEELTKQLGPALAALFSGDLQGAMDRAVALVGAGAAALAPQLARWTQVFLDWVQAMTPQVLQFLSDRLGDLWAWIRDTAPGLLETAIGTWIPAFVRWVDAVGPQVLAALIQFLSELGTWITDQAVPQLEAFGTAMGAAMVRGFGKALEQLGAAVDDAINKNPALRIALGSLPATAGLLPENRAAVAGTLPTVTSAAAAAAGRVHVEIRGMDIVVGVDPRQAAHEAGLEVEARVFDALTQSQATTDPGASSRQQGAGR